MNMWCAHLVDDKHGISKLCVLQVMCDQYNNAVLEHSTHAGLEQTSPDHSVHSTQGVVKDVHISLAVYGSVDEHDGGAS